MRCGVNLPPAALPAASPSSADYGLTFLPMNHPTTAASQRSSLAPLYALLVASILVWAGCGGGEGGAEGELSGSVNIDGSSTVYPITEAVAEEFMGEYPRVRVSVGVSGTGGGFSKFVRNETDINDASRPVKETEMQQAEEGGVSFIELPIAYDGLAVLANPENDWAECLTADELRAIWEPGSTVQNWSDVRSSFPDRPIALYGPGTDSGTYDYFTAAVVGEEGASRSDFTASEDDNVLIQGIAGDRDALGYVGLAYYDNNQDKLKLLGVDDGNPDNGDGCVLPTVETVNDGSYQPLARPEFIYVNAESADREVVQTFVNFYLENAGELARQVGYVPLSDEAYDLVAQRFAARTTGTMFSDGGGVGVRIVDLLRQSGSDTTSADAMP